MIAHAIAHDQRGDERRVRHRLPGEQEVERHGGEHEAGGQARAPVHHARRRASDSSATAAMLSSAKGIRMPHSV